MWRRSHQDFRNEIKSHLQIEIDRLIEEGASPQEAEARARQNFGNVTCVAERFYESNRLLWLDNLWKDLTYAARALLRQPMLVAVACVSLALGTGLNTAFFALIDSVLLRPVTVEAPGSLVMLWIGSSNRISEANYHSIREAGIPLTGHRIHDELKFQAGDEPVSIAGQEVSLDYFDSLGIPVAHGTRLTGDVLKSNPDAVVVTHRFWRDYLHSDFAAIGRRIRLSGKSLTVVGVLPQDMQSIWGIGIAPQVYFATGSSLAPGSPDREALRYELLGRLSPGESIQQFRDRVLARAKTVAETFPVENRDLGRVQIWPFPKYGLLMREGGGFLAPVVSFTVILFVLLGLVLTIACANIASILLARAVNRQREIAIRLSIGCSRTRLLQLLFAESFLLSIMGAALGAALGVLLAQAASRVPLPIPLPLDVTISFNWRIFAYASLLAIVATLLAATAPMWQTRRARPIDGLHGNHVKGAHRGRWNLRRVLVTIQVTIATILLIASSLFLRSLWLSTQIHPGFDMEHIATIELDLRGADIDRSNAADFEQQAIRRITSIPGIVSASAVSIIPLSMNSRITSLEVDEGGTTTRSLSVRNNTVAPEYFQTMGIPVVQGREFTADDVSSSAPVAVINRTFARRVFGDKDAIGRRIRRPNDRKPEPWVIVVGVVADSSYATLGESTPPVLYWLRTRDRSDTMTLVARTQGQPLGYLSALRSALREVDPRVTSRVRPLNNVLSLALFPARAAATLFGLLAIVALGLTITGLYGLITYTVSHRRTEIGVRVALGATQRAVVSLFLGDGLRIAGVGLVIGVLLALAGGRVLQSLLVGIGHSDPISFILTVAILLLTTLTASYIPARQASRMDPMHCLREE